MAGPEYYLVLIAHSACSPIDA